LQGLLTGVWVAAGELPVARRRAVRAGSVLVLSAVASLVDRGEADEPTHGDDSAAGRDGPREVDVRKLAVTAGAIGASVGLVVGRRRFETRWLDRLTRDGHPHPQRALAVRLGLFSFAGTLPARLIKVYEQRRRF
jgi:hypothetical protein